MSNVLKPMNQRGQILFKENNNLQNAIDESYSRPSPYRQFVQAIADAESKLAETHILIDREVRESNNSITLEERWLKIK